MPCNCSYFEILRRIRFETKHGKPPVFLAVVETTLPDQRVRFEPQNTISLIRLNQVN